MNAEIPDKVVSFNVYTQGTRLGTTGKVDTPEFKMKTSTMSGAAATLTARLPASGKRRNTRFRLRCLAKT